MFPFILYFCSSYDTFIFCIVIFYYPVLKVIFSLIHFNSENWRMWKERSSSYDSSVMQQVIFTILIIFLKLTSEGSILDAQKSYQS